jgi:sugar phosphate isomerase/epimerase
MNEPRVGYEGWLVMEDFSAARPPREALEHNLGFVRDLLQHVPARS